MKTNSEIPEPIPKYDKVSDAWIELVINADYRYGRDWPAIAHVKSALRELKYYRDLKKAAHEITNCEK